MSEGKQREDSYADLTRDQLLARLKVAEDVCVLTGWTAAWGDSERDRAALQMWMVWSRMAGPRVHDPLANVALDRMIPQLAAERARIRAETLRRIAGDGTQ